MVLRENDRNHPQEHDDENDNTTCRPCADEQEEESVQQEVASIPRYFDRRVVNSESSHARMMVVRFGFTEKRRWYPDYSFMVSESWDVRRFLRIVARLNASEDIMAHYLVFHLNENVEDETDFDEYDEDEYDEDEYDEDEYDEDEYDEDEYDDDEDDEDEYDGDGYDEEDYDDDDYEYEGDCDEDGYDEGDYYYFCLPPPQ